ncbi:MAG: hypothetical protein R3B84_02450 [Zavarzinella sp.]
MITSVNPDNYCILNTGGGAWAFASLASQLSRALWVDVADDAREYNYLLLADQQNIPDNNRLFIPFSSMELAADKRALARVFLENSVPIPDTHLFESIEDAKQFANINNHLSWCLKFPTGCGASGHRMLLAETMIPDSWPHPLIVQEFVHMQQPEVYRLYAAGGEIFGWVARRFPNGATTSPWVAHARGARYELAGIAPQEAVAVGRSALIATGLLGFFGCVDLIFHPSGKWVVLEVGTDGMFNHVDRNLELPALELEIQSRIAESFWGRLGDFRPWGTKWHIRPTST